MEGGSFSMWSKEHDVISMDQLWSCCGSILYGLWQGKWELVHLARPRWFLEEIFMTDAALVRIWVVGNEELIITKWTGKWVTFPIEMKRMGLAMCVCMAPWLVMRRMDAAFVRRVLGPSEGLAWQGIWEIESARHRNKRNDKRRGLYSRSMYEPYILMVKKWN